MTLQEAIAEVKSHAENNHSLVLCVDGSSVATILAAIASGDLIPKADAEQAVAVAYQRVWVDLNNRIGLHKLKARSPGTYPRLDEGLTSEILALAPAGPMAEVQALRAALESIASNTCCDGCQEAALVARAALGGAG